jgi:hypothetical protein
LEGLSRSSAVLVLESGKYLKGIITDFDVNRHFLQDVKSRMHVEDIELTIQNLIQESYQHEPDKLSEAIRQVCSRQQPGEIRKVLKKYPDGTPSINEARLQQLYLKELSQEHQDILHFCADWLNRIQDARQQPPPSTPEAPPIAPPPKEQSTYAPLCTHLKTTEGQEKTLSFQEIEAIIGAELPASAHQHRAWWANDAKGHVQAKAWLNAGWKASVNLSEKQVYFTRIDAREAEMIDFIAELLSALHKQNIILPNETSIDRNRHRIIPAKVGSHHIGWFTVGFPSKNQLKIDLDIDTGKPALNKRIFDELFQKKASFEAVNLPIQWERLDRKATSRLAIYRSCPEENLLQSLQTQTLQDILKLLETVQPLLPELAPLLNR